MRIIHLSTADISGGAAKAAFRLHVGLRRRDIVSQMLVARKDSDRNDIVDLGRRSQLTKIWKLASSAADRLPVTLSGAADRGNHSPAYLGLHLPVNWINANADIVNLHWICGGFIRPERLLNIQQPVVWTLHDMWAFSGAEHYVGSQKRYIEGYRKNNRSPQERGWDIDRWVWERKRKIYSRIRDLVVVAPSRWIKKCAEDSTLLGERPIEHIPYGVDHERFRPIDRNFAREVLGLQQKKKLILFSSGGGFADRRKGFELLSRALERIGNTTDARNYQLVIVGASEGAPERFGYMEVSYLGKLHDEISLALSYAAVDVVVAPSKEDNLPLVVLESLACGTPVVAFRIGGMPDLLMHHENGVLVEPFNTDDLGDGLVWVLQDISRWERLCISARRTIESAYTLEHQAKAYSELYERLRVDCACHQRCN